MKGVIIFAIIFCAALVGLGVFLSGQSSGDSRIVTMNQQYLDREANSGWVRGATKPTVQVTEYGDYQSAGTASISAVITNALAETASYTQFTFRPYPNSRNPTSLFAAEAAEAAGRQGKYWEMHDFLFATQTTWETKSKNDFQAFITTEAQAFHINVNQFQNDLNDSSIDTEINKDKASGNQLGLTSTPALVVNGALVQAIPTTVANMVALFENANASGTPTPSETAGL